MLKWAEWAHLKVFTPTPFSLKTIMHYITVPFTLCTTIKPMKGAKLYMALFKFTTHTMQINRIVLADFFSTKSSFITKQSSAVRTEFL